VTQESGDKPASHLQRSHDSMSWVEITLEMSYVFEACRTWPLSPDVLDQLRGMPEWGQGQAWVGSCERGQVIGTGSRHAGILPKGKAQDFREGSRDPIAGRQRWAVGW
jgi:hypothetical protein